MFLRGLVAFYISVFEIKNNYVLVGGPIARECVSLRKFITFEEDGSNTDALLAEILYENHHIPKEDAKAMCSSYLKSFRQCPDKETMSLDVWRHFLWTEALLEPYTQLADTVYLQWLELRYHYLAITPDIKSLLIKLRQHYLLGLITNGPSCAQWEKVERLDLQHYFDVILVSGDLPWEKPNRKIFQKACNYLGVEASRCVMVGDKLETDIQGGIEAELGYTIWVPLNDCCLTDKDPCPDFTLTTVTDLVNLLPCNNKIPTFRSKSLGTIKNFSKLNKKMLSLPDLDDCNSNSSDGS